MLSLLLAFPMFASGAALQDPSPLVDQYPLEGQHPLDLDRTGVHWIHPFTAARKAASEQARLLLVMPDDFAPMPGGGFSPTLELLRARVLSDERVAALVNRRFVPFYFNLGEGTPAYDEDAFRFVVAERKELGAEEKNLMGGPPILLMTPKGKVVGELFAYATPEDVLATLQRVLKNEVEFGRPAKAEKEGSPLERARVLAELQDYAGAEKILKKEKSEEAHYLLGHLARLRGDWAAMDAQLRDVRSDALAQDVLLEQAHRLWTEKKFAELAASLHGFPQEHPRWSEARYYEGLAVALQGRMQEALALWGETIHQSPQTPWVYRADWACVSAAMHPEAAMSLSFGAEPDPNSPLGRAGYSFPNPDLLGPALPQ